MLLLPTPRCDAPPTENWRKLNERDNSQNAAQDTRKRRVWLVCDDCNKAFICVSTAWLGAEARCPHCDSPGSHQPHPSADFGDPDASQSLFCRVLYSLGFWTLVSLVVGVVAIERSFDILDDDSMLYMHRVQYHDENDLCHSSLGRPGRCSLTGSANWTTPAETESSVVAPDSPEGVADPTP